MLTSPSRQRQTDAGFSQGSHSERWVQWAGGFLLLSTLAIAIVWSHYRLFWVDELLEFYTDTKPTVGAIVWGQLHAPSSFEPPLFHVLLHGLLRVLAPPEFAARLLSMLSLLVTEACAFLLTRSLVPKSRPNRVAPLFAMVLPLFLCSIDYAPEARIYSLQLATAAVSILAYQRATLRGRGVIWHVVLGLSVAIAVLTHYFGILVILPVWAAELTRTLQRKAVDKRTVAALALGTVCVLANIPFARALSAVRANYYNSGETSWWMVPFTYLWFKVHFWIYPLAFFHLRRTYAAGLLCTALVLLFAIRGSISGAPQQRPVRVALSVSALLPVLNLVLAQFLKAYVPRYSLPALIGISVLAALFLSELLNDRWLAVATLGLYLWSCFYSYGQIRMFRAWKAQMQTAHLTPGQQRIFDSLPDQHIYVQDTAKYLVLHRYKQLPFEGVVSARCELHWSHRNTDSVIAGNLAKTTGVTFRPFEQLHADPQAHLILYFGDWNNEWISREMQAEQAKRVEMGGAFEGQLALVRFSSGPACE